MMKNQKCCAIALFWLLVLSAGYAQAQTGSTKTNDRAKESARPEAARFWFNEPALTTLLTSGFGPNAQSNGQGGIWSAAKLKGGGTIGAIPVWTGTASQGDSIITQGSGSISIGGTLTTTGIITTSGGIRFPDGTLQTSAATGGGGGGGGGGLSLPFRETASTPVNTFVFDVENKGLGGGLFGKSNNGFGVVGQSTNEAGVAGQSVNAAGVVGVSTGGNGVIGRTTSSSRAGVRGENESGDGVAGQSTSGIGVRGISSDAQGLFGESGDDIGVEGTSRSSFGVVGRAAGRDVAGVAGTSTGGGLGVFGLSNSGIAVRGDSASSFGLVGVSTSGDGVRGESASRFGVGGLSNSNVGVFGQSESSDGVRGQSNGGIGVVGRSINNCGVVGTSGNFQPLLPNAGCGVVGVSVGNGVVGSSVGNFAAILGFGATGSAAGIESHGVSGVASTGVAVRGESIGSGLAGRFVGNVSVIGNHQIIGVLSKSGGSFKIDHPLDPENKYLSHSFVESPDMMNIYNGNITTDENGDAVVTLPEYFEALNKDFRYQLTVIGTFAQAIIANEVENNRFTIKTNGPNVKVSWQVTGIRRDPFAEKHRIPVEQAKSDEERGYYLNPEAYGKPKEMGVEQARDLESSRQMRKAMIEAGASPESLPPPGSGAVPMHQVSASPSVSARPVNKGPRLPDKR